MIKTIDGIQYLMRDQRPLKALRRMYTSFQIKYPDSRWTFHQWLGYSGRVSMCYGPKKTVTR